MFVHRAAMAQPRFALTDENVHDVVNLCRRLDGLPLAIELAAARSRLLTPHAMLSRIDERLGLGFTAADRAPRQRSLGDTIAWSYNLLDGPDQQFFRRLGVFSSSCGLEAIEAVVGFDVADSLDIVARHVDASLVQVAEATDGEPRISMLQTIRSFARDRLDSSGEAGEIHLRHARWCAATAAEVDGLLGSSMQVAALDRLDAAEEDIRAALAWCLRPASEVGEERMTCGFDILSAMTTYWHRFGYLAEGRSWLERGVAVAGSLVSGVVVDALHGLALMLVQQNEVDPAIRAFERALDMAQRLGDGDRESRESNSLGIAYREAGDLPEARRLIERSLVLAREVGSDVRAAAALANIVMLLVDAGEYGAALVAAEEAVAADVARGDRWGVAITEANVAMALLHTEGPRRSYEHLTAIAAEAVASADTELSITIVELFAMALSELGDATRAGHLVGAADARRQAVGMPRAAPDAEHLNRSLAHATTLLTPEEWDSTYAAGLRLTIDEAVAEALAARVPSG